MNLRCTQSRRWLPAALAAAWCLALGSAQAQLPTSNSTNPAYDPGSVINSGRADMGIPENRVSLAKRMALIRAERYKHMVENTNRLLALTQQFQAETQGRALVAADAKRLDEIAKLAHTVKEQMLAH